MKEVYLFLRITLKSNWIMPCFPCKVRHFSTKLFRLLGFIFLYCQSLNEVKCSVTELVTRSDCSQLLSLVLLYLRMRWIPCALDCRAYSSVWREEGTFSVKRLAVFPLPSPPFTFHCFSVWQGPVFLGAWGLMAGLSGFFSHRCILHLGAGCR